VCVFCFFNIFLQRYADLVGLQMSAQEDGAADEETNTYSVAEDAKTAATAAARAIIPGSVSINQVAAEEANESTPSVKAEVDLVAEKKENSAVLSRIWKLVLRHPLWMLGGLFGKN